MHSPKEAFSDVLQNLTSAVNRTVSDLGVRKDANCKFLAFEHANSECKTLIRPLQARSAPTEEWIRNMGDTGSQIYDSTVILVISQSSNFIKMPGGKPGHLTKIHKPGIPRKSGFPRNNPKRRPQSSGVCRRYGKGQHWICKVKLCLWEHPLRPTTGSPESNSAQSYPVSLRETHPYSN